MLIIVIAYLIGAIPTGYLARRLLTILLPFMPEWLAKHQQTLMQLGSISADAGKGIILVLAISELYLIFSAWGFNFALYPFVSKGLATSAAIIIGVIAHILSVHISGWGGKGSAVILGGFLVLTPLITLYALLALLIVLAVSRKMSFGSFCACCILPILIYLLDGEQVPLIAASVILAILSITTHSEGILNGK